jgi:2-polyprenyl-3-methyl-5-hydroxy-6-metoxy-1,4-benzoquinol methylase
MREHDIRPEALLNKYIELVAQDAEICFDNKPRMDMACVACGGSSNIHQFDKNGFAYTRCEDCATLFQSPRPSIDAFETFYRESKSSLYWAEVFFPAVAEIRREKIFRPRVARLADICEEKGAHVERLIDVGAGYGIFLDEWLQRFPDNQVLAIEPSTSLAGECENKGLSVVNDIVENVKGHEDSADLVVCFEVLEHVYDPLIFIKVLKGLVKPGGYVFISTLCIDGFDLQVLWDKSSQISPPHHINFLSLQGFEKLFQRAGLSEVNITTPGQLDVDIVRNAAKNDSGLLDEQRFLRNLLADQERGIAFQSFLREQRLSSHSWVIGRKSIDG